VATDSKAQNLWFMFCRPTITLRFLATGDNFDTLEKVFRVSKSSLTKMIPETCRSIILVLQDYIKVNYSRKRNKVEYTCLFNFLTKSVQHGKGIVMYRSLCYKEENVNDILICYRLQIQLRNGSE